MNFTVNLGTLVRSLLVILLTFAAPALASGQQVSAPSPLSVTLVMPGDVIRVQIWREGDLSGDFMVDEAGVVTLPLLGQRNLTGSTMQEVRDSLIVAYQAELRNPSIIITPLRRVFVLGEVNQPGLKMVDPTVSLAGAISLAGGANPNGDLSRIRVVRNGEVILEDVAADRGLALVDIRSGDEIFVGRRGWFDRNSTFVVSALLSVTSLVISILR